MSKTITVSLADLKKLVDYCYAEEETHLDEMGEGAFPGHIFHSIRRLHETLAQKKAKKIVVDKVVCAGEMFIKPGTTQDELIQQAGDFLDGSCSGEILGDVCFQGKDGKYYRMTVEAEIQEVDKAWADKIAEMYPQE